MKILITGASGYIGKNIFKHLLKENLEVFGQVRDKRAIGKNLFFNDFSNDQLLESLTSEIDVIINCIGLAHVKDHKKNNEDFESANFLVLKKILKYAKKNEVKKIIHLSSVSVYGKNPPNQPVNNTSSFFPYNNYSLSKFKGEEFLKDFATKSNIPINILRLPMVYGPKSPGNFSFLVKWIEKNLPILLSESSERSFLAIDNLNEVIKEIVINKSNTSFEAILSDQNPIKIIDFLAAIKKNLNSHSLLLPVKNRLAKFLLSFFQISKLFYPLFHSFTIEPSELEEFNKDNLKSTEYYLDKYLKND